MVKKFLVIEDLGMRLSALKRATENIKLDAEIDKIEAINQLVPHRDATTIEYPPEKLAEYDGFFVDFHLATEMHHTGERFDLHSASGGTIRVKVTTGIGVLLYLRQVQETPEYQQVRAEIRRERPDRPLRAPFYSFSLLQAPATLFFAPAARSWFGATHFSMQLSTVSALETQLKSLDSLDTSRYGGREVQKVASAFDSFMTTSVSPAKAEWNIKPGLEVNGKKGEDAPAIKDMYDWLQLYLEANGKRGTLNGFIDAVYDRHEIICSWDDVAKSYAPKVVAMQQAMFNYLSHFRASPVHASEIWKNNKDSWITKTKEGRAIDPLWGILNDSQFFWTQDDVRVALTEHNVRVARRGSQQ